MAHHWADVHKPQLTTVNLIKLKINHYAYLCNILLDYLDCYLPIIAKQSNKAWLMTVKSLMKLLKLIINSSHS